MFVSLFLRGYFSPAVVSLITTEAKLYSARYIESVIKEEVVNTNYDFFYDSVSHDGVLISSFDTNKANMVLSNTMNTLKNISDEFNSSNSFNVNVPISYLFIPSSYILSDIKLNVKTSSLLYYDVSLKTDIKEYGINNSLVTLSLNVNISYQVMVPMIKEVVDDSMVIPLSIELVNGKVPEMLFSS